MKSIIIKRIAPHGKFDYLVNTYPCLEFGTDESAALRMTLQQAVLIAYSLHRMRIRHYMIRLSAEDIEADRAFKIA